MASLSLFFLSIAQKNIIGMLNHSHMCLHLKVSTYRFCYFCAMNQKISTFFCAGKTTMASKIFFKETLKKIIKNDSADFCLSSESDSIMMSINICSTIYAVINICLTCRSVSRSWIIMTRSHQIWRIKFLTTHRLARGTLNRSENIKMIHQKK